MGALGELPPKCQLSMCHIDLGIASCETSSFRPAVMHTTHYTVMTDHQDIDKSMLCSRRPARTTQHSHVSLHSTDVHSSSTHTSHNSGPLAHAHHQTQSHQTQSPHRHRQSKVDTLLINFRTDWNNRKVSFIRTASESWIQLYGCNKLQQLDLMFFATSFIDPYPRKNCCDGRCHVGYPVDPCVITDMEIIC